MSFNVRVDSFRNKNDDGPVEVPSGLSVDSGELTVNGKVNLTGVSTVGHISAQHSAVGVITGAIYYGDGANLTNLPTTVSISKSIALKLLLSDPPLRS